MVICSQGKRNRRGDLEQWLGERCEYDFARRTGYVAVTRPRKLLLLAVPSVTSQELLERLSHNLKSSVSLRVKQKLK